MIEDLGKASKWDYRFFHVKTDGKIRELDVKEVRKNKLYNSERLLVFMNKTNIGFMRDGRSFNMKIKNLQEILSVANEGKDNP
jgi:hypothetical protein